MSEEYTYATLLLTNLLPHLFMPALFASFILGISVRYLKDPLA